MPENVTLPKAQLDSLVQEVTLLNDKVITYEKLLRTLKSQFKDGGKDLYVVMINKALGDLQDDDERPKCGHPDCYQDEACRYPLCNKKS